MKINHYLLELFLLFFVGTNEIVEILEIDAKEMLLLICRHSYHFTLVTHLILFTHPSYTLDTVYPP